MGISSGMNFNGKQIVWKKHAYQLCYKIYRIMLVTQDDGISSYDTDIQHNYYLLSLQLHLYLYLRYLD